MVLFMCMTKLLCPKRKNAFNGLIWLVCSYIDSHWVLHICSVCFCFIMYCLCESVCLLPNDILFL